LTEINSINTEALTQDAKASEHKEAFSMLEKNQVYRIGVGARADSTDATSFFMEVLINLTMETCKVNILRLEKTLNCLKMLQARGYSLTFEGGNCISCEKKFVQHPDKEYATIKTTLKTAFK
jgi:hypothetical protein